MSNQASELYELCKRVYELTGWKQRANISELYEYWDDHDELCVISVEDSDDGLTPAYNSDYLLEKLLPITSIQLKRKANGDIRLFYFPEKPDYATYDYDTPLKCLLALTIALSEAGELK